MGRVCCSESPQWWVLTYLHYANSIVTDRVLTKPTPTMPRVKSVIARPPYPL